MAMEIVESSGESITDVYNGCTSWADSHFTGGWSMVDFGVVSTWDGTTAYFQGYMLVQVF